MSTRPEQLLLRRRVISLTQLPTLHHHQTPAPCTIIVYLYPSPSPCTITKLPHNAPSPCTIIEASCTHLTPSPFTLILHHHLAPCFTLYNNLAPSPCTLTMHPSSAPWTLIKHPASSSSPSIRFRRRRV